MLDPVDRAAVLGYRASGNLGDAVQSYSLINLLDSLVSEVAIVDRDDVAAFTPDVAVRLIMNGFLLQRPDRFAIAPNVSVSMVGVHVTPSAPLYSSLPSFEALVRESPHVRRVFDASSPVGARDLFTLNLMHELGIESYFAGCLTLTLPARSVDRGDVVTAVDVPLEVCRDLESRLGRPVVRITNSRSGSWLSRDSIEALVVPYLDQLAGSSLVVTTRLHAALPALALGTSVIFAPEDPSDPRFSGLADFLPRVVALRDLLSLPASFFAQPAWEPVRDHTEQARIAAEAVRQAVGGWSAVDGTASFDTDKVLMELELARLVRERIELRIRIEGALEERDAARAALDTVEGSRIWRYSQWIRKARARVGRRAAVDPAAALPPLDDALLAEAVDHAVSRIEGTERSSEPFFHVYVEDLLPTWLFSDLDAMRRSCKETSATADRFQDNAAFTTRRLSLAEDPSPACRYLKALMSDQRTKAALLRKFYTQVDGDFVDAVTLHEREFEFTFCAPGWSQDVHVDIPSKYISIVLYFPDEGLSAEDWARNSTVLYSRVLEPTNAGAYRANAAAVFAPHLHTYHGFSTTCSRDALVMFLIDPVEKADWEAAEPAREVAPFDLFRSFAAAKLRRRPMIEYAERNLDIQRAVDECLVNAPFGRVRRGEAAEHRTD